MSIGSCIHNACVATQDAHAVVAGAPGFWAGLWHGLIFPLAWIASLFLPQVAIYAVPNSGGWYDFGFLLGAGSPFFGIFSGRRARNLGR